MSRYNPDIKYRCDIIRGKAKNEMDDLLPLYAKITHDLAPLEAKAFKNAFDEMLAPHLGLNQKTVRNQRSEMGKLFSLYYEEDGIMYESEICRYLIKTGDQPAYFKNLCLNFQFPNGTQKKETVTERIKDGIRLKPYHFILALLTSAKNAGIILDKKEIAYYALSSKEVLMGKVTPYEVLETIMNARNTGSVKELTSTSFTEEPKENSYIYQHINELYNYLEIANLVTQDSHHLYLNAKEQAIIDIFIKEIDIFWEIEDYLDENGNATEYTRNEWSKHYGKLYHGEDIITTTSFAIVDSPINETTITKQTADTKLTSNQIGDEGEQYVLAKEKDRVRTIRPMWTNRVKYLGNIRGLGYDIQSVDVNDDCLEAFNRMIEVKTTKRVTLPNFTAEWGETLDLTVKEWEAAKQFGEHYYIYRVYLTQSGVFVYMIQNPYQQFKDGKLFVYPSRYQVDINSNNINQLYND